MSTGTTGKTHYPALDGLRGVAILLVVILHNFRFMNYFFFGWLGVDLFFVLSGFLITDILMNKLGQPHFLRNFYLRRVFRIFPLFYLTLIIFLLILPHVKSYTLHTDYYTSHQFWLWTYLQNWLFIFKAPYGDPVLLHIWSLGVEEQFYLFWPLVILLFRKPKILLAIVLLLLVAVGITRYLIWINKIEDLAYASLYTFTRIDGICIGCLLALLLRINPGFLKKNTLLLVLLMAAINFGFYFINNRHAFTLPYLAFVGYSTFAVLFGILVYEAVTGESRWIQFIFNNRILRFFGRISYGFYVFHWPVYMLFYPPLLTLFRDRAHFSIKPAELAGSLLVTGIAILISVISFRFFESPILKLKSRYN